MSNQIFYDPNERRKLRSFHLKNEIRAGNKAYDLEDWIDRGGNATIYRGREKVTGQECAIKFLIRSGSESLERFRREFKLSQLVASDHLIKYYGNGSVQAWDDQKKKHTPLHFVVMELAEHNLQNFIHGEEEPLGYERYAGQFRGLAHALALLHGQDAIHRDIKPENILVVGERWVLSDFGLCSFISDADEDLTGEKKNLGPRFWLSPEAHNRRLGCEESINAASDVFQLASIFWYVATGRHPAGIVTKDDWAGPAKIFNVLYRSLFHDFRKRPQNGSEFFTEIEDALSR